MKNLTRTGAFLALCALAVSSFAAEPQRTKTRNNRVASHPGAETDNATLRRDAQRRWYETAWSPEFKKFMNNAAARERAKYRDLLPAGDAGLTASPESFAAAVTGSTWSNIGPNRTDVLKNGSYTLNNITDTGRVRSIVFEPGNPNTIYVAFSGGGVWKSLDAGVSWTAKTDTLGSLSCGSLVMDPANPQTLYLGLGDPFDGTGIGLVKSIDGGNNWSAPVYLGSSTRISQVFISPVSSSILVAATDKGIYRSADAGASWSLISLATGGAGLPQGWAIDWNGMGFVVSLEASPELTTGTTNGQVWTSNADGTTWTKSTGMAKSTGVGRISVAAAPTNRLIMYAMAAIPNSSAATDLADLFKSADGGKTWTALAATANKVRYTNSNTESTSPKGVLNGQGWYNHLLIVDPTDPKIFYFGGALLLARGDVTATAKYTQLTNWLAQFSLPYAHADFHAAAFDANKALFVGSDGGVFRSTDVAGRYAAGWTDDLNNGIASHLIYSVGSSLANVNAVVGGFQDNGTRVRSGSTSTFNQYLGGDGFGSLIHPTAGSTMLGTLYNTRIYKSTNGGTTFTSASSGITESNTANAPFNTKLTAWQGDSTGNTVYTHVNTKVYRSTNYAGTWTALGTSGLPTTNLFLRNVGVAKLNGSVLGVVANGGRAYLSNNGGTSWTEVSALPNNGFSLSYISFSNANTNVVYVASVAPDGSKNHLWRSDNFGASWTAIDGAGFPQGVPVDSIVNDPNDANVLYAGTHLGVYKSLDNGASWTRFGTGMPLVQATDFYISPDGSLVRASTFGRGFWQLQ